MKSEYKHLRLWTFLAALSIAWSFGTPALAIDDGARAYWKTREKTQGISLQYLRLDLNAEDTQQFAPGQYIYPNADIEGSLVIANWMRHITLFDRPSSFSVGLAGGDTQEH